MYFCNMSILHDIRKDHFMRSLQFFDFLVLFKACFVIENTIRTLKVDDRRYVVQTATFEGSMSVTEHKDLGSIPKYDRQIFRVSLLSLLSFKIVKLSYLPHMHNLYHLSSVSMNHKITGSKKTIENNFSLPFN